MIKNIIDDNKINQIFSNSIESLKELLKIPSFYNKEMVNEEYPYGKDVHRALEYVINLGKEMGFKTKLGDKSRYGYIEYGEGDGLIGILCHLDVVPPGDLSKWENPPFEPVIKDDYIYARGAIDDKGPAIINLYALKYLVDQGIKFKNRIRLIFGITEETTWDSINFYIANEEIPNIAYTPDGEFPLVYAEKTILDLKIVENQPEQDYSISGGAAYNVTCDQAIYKGSQQELLINQLKEHNFEYKLENNELVVLGRAAHGSKPNEGINAGLRLLIALSKINSDSKLTKWVSEELKLDVNANKIFNDLTDESGKLTINIGIINFSSKENWIGCNLRIPVHTSSEIILDKLNNSVKEYNLVVEKVDLKKKLFFDKKSIIVTTLLNVFQKHSKNSQEPIAIGGGTYARSMDNCVAFGAIFDSSTSTEHKYNEKVSLTDLKLAMKIYVDAIVALDNIEKEKSK